VYWLNFFSNSAFFGPVVIHPDRNTSDTAAIPSSPMDGRENGKNVFLIKILLS
jgi:hypothetical protein